MTHAEALRPPLAHGLARSDCTEPLSELGSFPDTRIVDGVPIETRITVWRCRACQVNIATLDDGQVLNVYPFANSHELVRDLVTAWSVPKPKETY